MMTKDQIVKAIAEVRDNLNAVGRHACPGFDCATCQQSHNVELLDAAIAGVQALSAADEKPKLPYPPGMGEESRRLHREYLTLVAAQRAGAKNGADVVRLTDECAAKGIVLVPGGENL